MTEAAWSIEAQVTTIATPDLDRAEAFYARLGFVAAWRWPVEAPTHVGVTRGAAGALILCLCDPAVRADVTFYVDDVDACHAAVLAGRVWEHAADSGGDRGDGWSERPPRRALQPPEAPQDQPYGLRDFVVIDPWGNQLTFAQHSHD